MLGSDKLYALKTSSPYAKKPHDGMILHRLKDVFEVAKIEVYAEWPRSGLQRLLYNMEWILTPPTISSRNFQLIVTEWLPGSLQDKDLDFVDYLVVWKKLYIAVAHIGERGFLHRDLSFGNVRVIRTKINGVDDLEVKLINFDLVDEVNKIGQGEASTDRTGITLFIPIEILRADNPPPRYKQHEDETAFWFIALAIFARYFRNSEVQTLFRSTTGSYYAKHLFLVTFLLAHDCSWLEGPVEEFKVYVDFFRYVCDKMLDIQFKTYAPFFKYPSVEERKDGKKMQQTEHLRINLLIFQVLDSAINTLRAKNVSKDNLTDIFWQLYIDNKAGNA